MAEQTQQKFKRVEIVINHQDFRFFIRAHRLALPDSAER
jgi:hypothetical protein